MLELLREWRLARLYSKVAAANREVDLLAMAMEANIVAINYDNRMTIARIARANVMGDLRALRGDS
jgi:hypothetical protein